MVSPAWSFSFDDIVYTFQDDFDRTNPVYMQDRLKTVVSELSAMPINRKVDISFKNRGDLRDALYAYDMKKSNLEDENAFKGYEYLLKQLHLVQTDFSLKQNLYDSYYADMYGFYNPATKKMVILEKGNRQIILNTLLHEFVHVAQDDAIDLTQYFDRYCRHLDADLAARSLVEGQAATIELLLRIEQNKQERPTKEILEDVLKNLRANHHRLLSEGYDVLMKTRVFPYSYGMTYVLGEYVDSGKAFKDMFDTVPLSTEQLLHPEKSREEPVSVKLENRIAKLTSQQGVDLLFDTTLGEFFILQSLNHLLPSTEEKNRTAAAGWGGDHVFVMQAAGKPFIVWDLLWDSKRDAKEFHATYLDFTKVRFKNAKKSPHRFFDATFSSGGNDQVYIKQTKNRVVIVEGDVPAKILEKATDIL